MISIQTLIWIIFILVSIINSILDIKTMHISLFLNYSGITITVILLLIFMKHNVFEYLISAILLCLIFLLVRLLSHKGLGLGDIHYSLYCGVLSSVFASILSAFFAASIGIMAFILLKIFIREEKVMYRKIPFVPFMFLGTIIGNLFSNYIIEF